MEPWSFGSDGIGKGLLFSDEMDLPFDAFARNGNALMEWETKPYYSFENTGLVSDKVVAESVEFIDLGFTDIMRKPIHCNQPLEAYGGELGNDSSKASPTMLTPNSSFGEVQSGSKLSSYVKERNSHDDSWLVDLKLGRLADCDGPNSRITKVRSVLASGGSAMVAKRARTTSSPSCQVQGCKVDLSSSRDYYKKHKVCDVHSKTARIIVNGMEQRFCQQCSRFHLLVEFDDGKRSCRKRLAYHNERRKKPQSDSFSGKPCKLLQSVRGTRFVATSSPKRSPFVLYPGKYGESGRISQATMNRQLHAKSFPHFCGIGQQNCSGVSLDTASNVQELSGTSSSSCALSLLSTQSKDLSSYPAAITMHANHVGGQVSEIIAANELYSSVTNPTDADQMSSMMLPHGIVHGLGFPNAGSGFPNSQHWFSPERGTTVDLLQLSSRLQRVEQQRSSKPMKHENEDFSRFLTTQGTWV